MWLNLYPSYSLAYGLCRVLWKLLGTSSAASTWANIYIIQDHFICHYLIIFYVIDLSPDSPSVGVTKQASFWSLTAATPWVVRICEMGTVSNAGTILLSHARACGAKHRHIIQVLWADIQHMLKNWLGGTGGGDAVGHWSPVGLTWCRAWQTTCVMCDMSVISMLKWMRVQRNAVSNNL